MAQGDGDQAQPATRHTLQDPPLVPQCGTVLAGLVFSGEGLQVCGGPEKAMGLGLGMGLGPASQDTSDGWARLPALPLFVRHGS